jgi:hypothetical protein
MLFISEQGAGTRFPWAAHRVRLQRFCAAFETPLMSLTLDFYGTSDQVYGAWVGRHFD